MATKSTNDPAEVQVTIGYNLTCYLPLDDAVALNKLLLKATFLNFNDYVDGTYQKHTTDFPTIQLTPKPQTIQSCIEEAAILEMPLHQYMKEKGMPF